MDMDCSKPNALYEAICLKCDLKAGEAEQHNFEMEGIQSLQIKVPPVGLYIGETCKSVYTRSSKHFDNYRLADPTSFMLKHQIKYHREEHLGSIKFMFKVKRHFLSAFRRQVAEAVAIKMGAECDSHYLMNDKLEYNRCLIPDIF